MLNVQISKLSHLTEPEVRETVGNKSCVKCQFSKLSHPNYWGQ